MKEYIKPIVKVINVECGQMLAGSGELNDQQGNGVALGRGHRGPLTNWDDDEE